MQALRVGVICTHPFSRGDVCPPLLAVPVQLGMEARDASWPGVVGTPPPGDVHHPPPRTVPLHSREMTQLPPCPSLHGQQTLSPPQHPAASIVPKGQPISLQALPDLPKPYPHLEGTRGAKEWPGQSREGFVAPSLRFRGLWTFPNQF